MEGAICHDQTKVPNFLSKHFANIAGNIGYTVQKDSDTHASMSSIRVKSAKPQKYSPRQSK